MTENSQKGLIAWFAGNRVAANLLMVVILAAGLASVFTLQKEGFPPMDPSRITITVNYPSGDPAQAEDGIATRLEDALQEVEGIQSISIVSTGSGATATVEKKSRQDLDALFTDVKTRVDGISGFPSDARRPVIEKQTREERVIRIEVHGDTDRAVLEGLARKLRRDLLMEQAISRVDITGERTPEIAIEIADETLAALSLTLADVASAVKGDSLTETSGELQSKEKTIYLKAAQLGDHLLDFTDIPLVSTREGETVSLHEVATVKDGYRFSPDILSRFNANPSVGLAVIKAGKGDVFSMVTAARKVVTRYQESSLLPEGVHLSFWDDESVYIRDRLTLVGTSAFSGMILIFMVLALFLNFRVAVWVAMGIPVCVAGTLFVMGDGLLGLSLNELTTFGFILALGIIVDDAVVIGESVYTTRLAQGDTLAATIRGVEKVATPTVFGVLTTVAAFYPLSLIEGNLGKILSQFAMVVVCCLGFSLVESKLILPAHLATLNTRPKVGKNPIRKGWNRIRNLADGGMEALGRRFYRPLIRVALPQRYGMICTFVALLVVSASLMAGGRVRFVFFPDIPGDSIRGSFTMEDDTGAGLTHGNLMRLEETAFQVDAELKKEYGENKGAIAGIQVRSDADHKGSIAITLRDADLRAVGADAFIAKWREKFGALEGVRNLSVSSFWEGPDNLKIELSGSDRECLRSAGSAIRATLSEIKGVKDIEDDLTPGRPEVGLTLTDTGRALGFTTRRLAEEIRNGFYGVEVQKIQRNEQEVKVMVRYPAEDRRTMGDLLASHVRTEDGAVVPLSVVAKLETRYSASSVNRRHHRKSGVITANVDKAVTSPGAVIRGLQEGLFPKLQAANPDLSIRLSGEAEEQEETMGSMVRVFGLALLMIYVLLAIPLGSYVQPLVIMTAIPFGIVGAIFGHLVMDLSVGLLSIKGMLALSGVVVNNSLLLLSCYNDLRAEGMGVDQALEETGGMRLRAILLTSVTTCIGLIPLLQSESVQARYLIPAAASLAWGLAFSTGITLVLIPLLLRIWEDIKGCFLGGKKTTGPSNTTGTGEAG